MATSSKRTLSFGEACSGSEIKVSRFPFGEVWASPNAETFHFVAFRSSYPLAGCSPAEPASVSLDKGSLNGSLQRVNSWPSAWPLRSNPAGVFFI
jgi:hypothetical protein